MTTYIIEEHDTLPLIHTTWLTTFDFHRDAATYVGEVSALLDNQTQPVFYLMDLSKWNRMSFQELIDATNMAKSGNFKHEKNRGSIIVTPDNTVGAAARGMDSMAFGNVKLQVFETVEDALAYVQEQA